MLYTRFHLVAGGTTTGAFLSIVILDGHWLVALWIPTSAILIYAIFKFILLPRLALPKPWIFSMMVCTSVLLAGVFEAFYLEGMLTENSVLFAIVVYGSYITPGLLAYDFAHQDIKRTSLALVAVASLTILITTPLLFLSSGLAVGISGTEISPPLFFGTSYIWIETLACVVLGFILRFAFDLRSGGFIGPVFLIQFVSYESIVTVGVSAFLAWRFALSFAKLWPCTPRQAANIALISGAMIAWTGLYWASFLEWMPAIEANGFATAPLLAVGLIAADMTREEKNPAKVLVGVLLNTAGIFVITSLVANGYAVTGIGLLLGILVLALYKLVPTLQKDLTAARLAGATSGLRLNSAA
ncbi:MAG: putative biosynthesis protein capC [Actinomycetota bacterium]